MASIWTDELVARLKALSGKSLSGAQIAAELGISSRRAVTSKLHRLGLLGASKPASLSDEDRRAKALGPMMQKINARRAKGAPEIIDEFKPRTVDVASRRLTLIELGAFECRYPDLEGNVEQGVTHTFCGHAVVIGKSYCASHCELVRGVGTPSERAAVPAKLLRELVA